MSLPAVRIIVTLRCGHELIYTDEIDEKYPFWCAQCEDYFRTESYPWKLRTEIIATEGSTP